MLKMRKKKFLDGLCCPVLCFHTLNGYLVILYFPCLGDTVSPRKGRKTVLNICQRFHFASALKRMSTVCAMQSASAGPAHLITVKGAPEVLQDMFRSVPEGYETMYTKLTRQGARVLALGYRQMGSLSQREVSVWWCV